MQNITFLNTANRGTEATTNLATDMRTPTPSYWGPEYVTSFNEPLYMIETYESSDESVDSHELWLQGRRDYVRGVLEGMGLDPDAEGYEADSDTSPKSDTTSPWDEPEPSEGDDEQTSEADAYADLPALADIPQSKLNRMIALL